MGGIKFGIHPLFFLVGIYYALTGRIFVFLIYAVTAVVHECGHSLAAARRGYRLNKIILMPFGAVVTGNIRGLKLKDEAAIALAGPVTNLFIGFLFVAFWWIFPETYAFTDIAAEANFVLAAVNFIPIYPLDGGRIIFSVMSLKIGEKKAFRICRVIGIAFSVLLFAAFTVTLFKTPNVSLLIFAVFAFLGAVTKKADNVYVKAYSFFGGEKLLRGAQVNRFAVDKRTEIRTVIGLIDSDKLNEMEVYDGENKIATVGQKRLMEILSAADVYSEIGKYLAVPEQTPNPDGVTA